MTKQELKNKYANFDITRALEPLVRRIQGKIDDCLSTDDLELATGIDSYVQALIAELNDLPPHFLLLMSTLRALSFYNSKDVYFGYYKLAQADLNVAKQKYSIAHGISYDVPTSERK